MKRVLLITIASLFAFVAQAQEDTLKYHPFVQPGKTWSVHRLGLAASLRRTIIYSFDMEDAVETINGKEYLRMRASWSDGKTEDRGLFREEDRKVYFYDENNAREYKYYDFTLQVGDEFEVEYAHNPTRNKVTKTDYIVVNGERLGTITFQNGETWIEGVGYRSRPLEDSYSTGWSDIIAYVTGVDGLFLPFEIESHLNGLYGQPLVKLGEIDGEDIDPEYTDMLQYELFPERGNLTLHVFGYMHVQCGPNNYVWCKVENHKVSLQVEELEPLMDCKSWCKVDMYFPFFDGTYTAVDSRGGHVIQSVTDYRPFRETGKVWKIGWIGSEPILQGDELRKAKHLEYYYFDGDTLIEQTWCSRLVCRSVGYAGEEVSYKAAIHENGQRVYYVLPGEEKFKLLYDFRLTNGDTISLSNSYVLMNGWDDPDNSYLCTLVSRQAVETDPYKGIVLTISPCADQPNRSDYEPFPWMTGVGYMGPYNMPTELAGAYPVLMSCKVGDEIIYEDNYWIDAVTEESEVKKQWLDFTHTVKTKPKGPRKEGSPSAGSGTGMMEEGNGTDGTQGVTDEAQALTGEYSAKELFVSLQPLAGPYTVSISNAAGEVVYEKEVQTSNVVALNTDLTKYADGTYTLLVENADEAYTATLTIGEGTAIRNLSESPNNGIAPSSKVNVPSSMLFDLSGRRLSAPPARGVYIKDGKLKCKRN